MFGSMGQTNVKNLGNGGTMDGDVTITGDLTVSGGIGLSLSEVIQGTSTIDVTSTEALLVRKNGDGGDVFTVDTTNSKIIVGDISLSGSTISDNSALTISSGDDIIIDATSDINLDADGGDIRFKDNGTNFVTFSSSTGTTFFGDINIKSTGGNDDPAILALWSPDVSISADDTIGSILAQGSDSGGSPPYLGAKIEFNADANWDTGTSGYYPTRIDFFTESNSGTISTANAALTIDSSQRIGI